MSYCVNCGVELDSTASFCPLCRTPVVNPRQPVDTGSSPPFPTERREVPPASKAELAILVSSMLASVAVCCGLLNLVLRSGHIWSLYVIGAAAMLWVWLVPPLLLRTMHLYLRLSADVLAVALYVFLISVDLDGSAWYWHLALPIILLLGGGAAVSGLYDGGQAPEHPLPHHPGHRHHRRFSLRRGAAHRPLLPGPLAAGLVPGGAHSMRCPGHPPHRGAPGPGPARGSAQALSSVIRSRSSREGQQPAGPLFSPRFDIFMRI